MLRRLCGEPLDDLIPTAIGFARALDYSEVETVIPHGMDHLQRAARNAGFDATSPGAMLYRLALPAS